MHALPISWYTLETDGPRHVNYSIPTFNYFWHFLFFFSFFDLTSLKIFARPTFFWFKCLILSSSFAKIENFRNFLPFRVDGIFYFIDGRKVGGKEEIEGVGTLVASNNLEKEDLILSLLDPPDKFPLRPRRVNPAKGERQRGKLGKGKRLSFRSSRSRDETQKWRRPSNRIPLARRISSCIWITHSSYFDGEFYPLSSPPFHPPPLYLNTE